MNIDILYIVILKLGLAGLGTYLVVAEHYGWAWVPFLIAVLVSYEKNYTKDTDEN